MWPKQILVSLFKVAFIKGTPCSYEQSFPILPQGTKLEFWHSPVQTYTFSSLVVGIENMKWDCLLGSSIKFNLFLEYKITFQFDF